MVGAAENPASQAAFSPPELPSLDSFLIYHFSRLELEEFLEGGAAPAKGSEGEAPLQTWVQGRLEKLRPEGRLGRLFFQELEARRPGQLDTIRRLARANRLTYPAPLDPSRARASLDAQESRFARPYYVDRWSEGEDGQPLEARETLRRHFRELRRNQTGAENEGRAIAYLMSSIGTGKTRFAFEYAQRWRYEYEAILLLDAGDVPGRFLADQTSAGLAAADWVRSQLAAMALELDLVRPRPSGDLDEPAAVAALTRRFTRTGACCLLVVDNLVHLESVEASLPKEGCFDVLLISAQDGDDERAFPLRDLTHEEGARLILQGGGSRGRWSARAERQAAEMSRIVGSHLLALSILSGLLGRHRPGALLEWLQRTSTPLPPEAEQGARGYEAYSQLVTCLSMARDLGVAHSSGEERVAWLVLRCMAWVAPEEPVGREILSSMAAVLAEEEGNEFRPSWLNVGLEHLCATGLLWLHDGNPCAHLLIQDAQRRAGAGARSSGSEIASLARALLPIARQRLTDDSWRWLDDVEQVEPAFLHMEAFCWHLANQTWVSRLNADHLELCWRVVRMLWRSGQHHQADRLAAALEERADATAVESRADDATLCLRWGWLHLERGHVIAFGIQNRTDKSWEHMGSVVHRTRLEFERLSQKANQKSVEQRQLEAGWHHLCGYLRMQGWNATEDAGFAGRTAEQHANQTLELVDGLDDVLSLGVKAAACHLLGNIYKRLSRAKYASSADGAARRDELGWTGLKYFDDGLDIHETLARMGAARHMNAARLKLNRSELALDLCEPPAPGEALTDDRRRRQREAETSAWRDLQESARTLSQYSGPDNPDLPIIWLGHIRLLTRDGAWERALDYAARIQNLAKRIDDPRTLAFGLSSAAEIRLGHALSNPRFGEPEIRSLKVAEEEYATAMELLSPKEKDSAQRPKSTLEQSIELDQRIVHQIPMLKDGQLRVDVRLERVDEMVEWISAAELSNSRIRDVRLRWLYNLKRSLEVPPVGQRPQE